METLIRAIAGLELCPAKDRAIFQALVYLTQGFTRNVAMLTTMQTCLNAHDYLRYVSKELKNLAPDYCFYYHGVTKNFGVVGLGKKIYENVAEIK